MSRSFSLPGGDHAALVATNLHVIAPTATVSPSRGVHFVGFTLEVRNQGRFTLARAVRLREGLRVLGSAGAGSAAPTATDQLAAPGISLDDERRHIAPGETYRFALSGAVSDSAERLVFRGTFTSDPHGASKTVCTYVIDLGAAPAYRAAGDTSTPMGQVGLLNGVRLRVLRAFLVPGGGSTATTVVVGVDVEIGNPLTAPFYVEPLTLVTLESADGRRPFGHHLDPSLPEALESTYLAPRKQITGIVYYSVPRAALTGLRARFNPEVGQGKLVVPLGAF